MREVQGSRFNTELTMPRGFNLERNASDRVTLTFENLRSEFHINQRVYFEVEEHRVKISSGIKAQLETAKRIVFNWIKGMMNPYSSELEIAGIGYWVRLEDNSLTFKVGYSHLVNYRLPSGIECKIMGTRKLILSSIDKQLLGQTVARITAIKRPNPYRRNGIYILGREYPLKKISKKG